MRIGAAVRGFYDVVLSVEGWTTRSGNHGRRYSWLASRTDPVL